MRKLSAEETKAALADTLIHLEMPTWNTFEGNLVSLAGDKLVITNDGEDYTHTLEKDATISSGGAACTPEELQIGSRIRVTTRKDDRKVVTDIESLDNQAETGECCR